LLERQFSEGFVDDFNILILLELAIRRLGPGLGHIPCKLIQEETFSSGGSQLGATQIDGNRIAPHARLGERFI
jgi:hypothetical protein